jgi:hypothetical protein
MRDIYVGCNKRSALHRMEVSETSGAMPVGYCALRQLRHSGEGRNPAQIKNLRSRQSRDFGPLRVKFLNPLDTGLRRCDDVCEVSI